MTENQQLAEAQIRQMEEEQLALLEQLKAVELMLMSAKLENRRMARELDVLKRQRDVLLLGDGEDDCPVCGNCRRPND